MLTKRNYILSSTTLIFLTFTQTSFTFDLSENLDVVEAYFTCRNVKSVVIFDKHLKFATGQRAVKYYNEKFSKSLILFQIQISYEKLIYALKKNRNKKIGITLTINFSVNDPGQEIQELNEVLELSSLNENLILLVIIIGDGFINDIGLFAAATLSLSSDLVVGVETKLFLDNEAPPANCTTFKNYCFMQIYKIRKEENESVVVHSIGKWDYGNQTSCFQEFQQVEQRVNFHKFFLKVGKKNSTYNDVAENTIEDDSDEEKLIEIANYFKLFFNASIEIIYYQKLGLKESTGEWTGLLKGVVGEEVDVALDRVISTSDRYSDMVFSHQILKSIRSIYLKPQKSNQVRDIFLIPFNNKLIISVIGTGLICIVLMAIINKVNCNNQSTLGDATIWCIGIFSMQGSISRPKTCSGNVLLVVFLIFALIIYNSYSACITSILSVKTINIRSIDDLLASDYDIGYAKNSQDEFYLRAMNDTQLQQIYLRGYLKNNVFSVTEGLLKTAKGNYGFFASVNSARKVLQIINNYRCNYDIMEIPISVTKNSIAFPMTKSSPYRKIINLSIMRMYETGVHKYIHSTLVPNLPECEKKTDFQSAHLADLISAFAILLIALFLSIVLLIFENGWKRKQKMHCNKITKS